MSSTNDSTERCLETNGDIWFCQVFNMSFFSKSNARDLKNIYINPLMGSKKYIYVKNLPLQSFWPFNIWLLNLSNHAAYSDSNWRLIC
jgi:hypothetical protein